MEIQCNGFTVSFPYDIDDKYDQFEMQSKGYLSTMDEDYNDLEIPELERTGPYIPSLYIVNSRDVLLVEPTKNFIQNSDIRGIKRYVKTLKKHIVEIEWKDWSFDTEPRFYPESGEPEDYILEGKHDKQLAKRMPEVFLLDVEEKCNLKKTNNRNIIGDYCDIVIEGEPNLDIFTPTNMLYVVVSDRFKNTIEQTNVNSVVFFEIKIA